MTEILYLLFKCSKPFLLSRVTSYHCSSNSGAISSRDQNVQFLGSNFQSVLLSYGKTLEVRVKETTSLYILYI